MDSDSYSGISSFSQFKRFSQSSFNIQQTKMYSFFRQLTSFSSHAENECNADALASLSQICPSSKNLIQNSFGGLSKKFLLSAFPVVYAAGIPDVSTEMTEQEKLKAKIMAQMRSETKEERLRRMFVLNEFGDISPEMKYILTASYTTFIIGAVTGALFKGTRVKDDYLRRNVHTPFESGHLARRKFYDTLTMAAFRNGFTYGGKLTLSTTFYLLVTMSVANYNNKITIFEHVAAGAMFGGLARFYQGPRGMLVASGLGGFLGLCAGSIIKGYMKLADLSFEELRYWKHEYFMPEMKISALADKDN